MTVATEYFNYQRAGTNHQHYGKGVSPAIVDLKDYVMKRWGGMNLGHYGIRNTRGGTQPSTHSFGAAWDWRYMNADGGGLLGRAKFLSEVVPVLISNSKELGIQFIGDYVGCRVWKADRSGDANGGWKLQAESDEGMGQDWAGWMHVEVHPSVWTDGRSIEQKLGIGPIDTPAGPVPFPPFRPASGEFSVYPFADKPVIRLGAKGDIVKYLQGVLRKNGYRIGIDGDFGAITRMVVRTYQAKNGLFVDGVVGRQTWAAVDADAR